MIEKKTHEERIKKALESKEIETIYFNGFINSIGTADVLIILERNDIPVAVLNTSYTMAKTLVQKLGNLVSNLEEKTKNTIMTNDEINEKLKSKDEGKDNGSEK